MHNIPENLASYLNPRFVAKHPDKVERLLELYERYHPRKEQFLDKLNGKRPGIAIMKDLSPEDSKEVLALLRNLKYNPFSFRRRGRGPVRPPRYPGQHRQHLTIEESSRFSIYVYGHVGAREAGII